MSADKGSATAPAVSVVMPSMNQVIFLADAVRSVLTQEGPATELVVMDGGSDDGSQALLADLAKEFPGRLRWASGPDNGPAEAVNEAVRRTRAPLVGWLNSDDLYTPGAVARAAAHLASHPDHVMVYGHGDHVDGEGAFIERYPSRTPTAYLSEWVDGCHICQPTAFFRRAAFDAVGGLDSGFRASFDYELWLRLFKAYPKGVGFINEVQACSRLHAGSITTRFRERVAFEGMEVVRRHLGPAPAHWLLTHVDELCAIHPFLPGGLSLRARCEVLAARAAPYLDSEGIGFLHRRLATDPRLALATETVHVGVHADGWAGPSLDIRVQQGPAPVREIRLGCRQQTPGGGRRLTIGIVTPDGKADELRVDGNGAFELVLPVADRRPGARSVLRVYTEGGFVPALVEPSADRRELAFRVESCRVMG
ncbi:MAG: glycosyltransferase [Vitreoscilla sp.]|nr:glycosyltransferase [Vitreoscilla sp.]